MMSDGGRRLISFSRDIAEEVARESGGRFTKEQVMYCLDASVSFIHNALRYTDAMAVRIPYIGDVVCNLHEMEKRRDKLLRIRERTGSLNKYMGIELGVVERKIAVIRPMLERGVFMRGHPLIRKCRHNFKILRHCKSLEWYQDLQQCQFDR